MNEPLIFRLLAGLQREKNLALLERTIPNSGERDSFEQQAARNEALFSQIRADETPYGDHLPDSMLRTFALRAELSFREALDPDSLAAWYLTHLEPFAQQAAYAVLADRSSLAPAQASAMMHLVGALGFIGQLSAAGLSVYACGEVLSSDSTRMKMLAHACLTRERLFLNLADEKLRRIMQDLKILGPQAQSEIDEAMRRLDSGQAKDVLSRSGPSVWMNMFDHFTQELYRALSGALEEFASGDGTEQLEGSAGSLSGELENNLPSLMALPLFRGMREGAVRAALKGGRILDVEKNHLIATQGEGFDRLIIVLDGLVKSLKSTEDGAEIVVQILGKRECLLDTGFLGGVASLSVKTVTQAKLLSLSLPALREQIARTPVLAQNALALSFARLQKLVAHVEQITLRTAVQRVGWFLANLNLETGLEGAPLRLPCDKALIAAYLNIKPETFSRALTRFKQQGFGIEGDEITLPDPRALCAYCDPDMALRCCRAESLDCAPIRATRRAESK